MKTFFSEYQYDLSIRKSVERPSDAILDKAMLNRWNKSGDEGAAGIGIIFGAQHAMLAGEGIDYFIETVELADSLIRMVNFFTADALDVLAESRNTAFCVHPPSPMPAVLCGIRTWGAQTLAVFSEGGLEKGGFLGLAPSSFITGEKLQGRAYAEKLVIGLALYMRHFPHAVRDGIPEIAKHPSHYKGTKCASVCAVEEITDRSGPKPHLRICHFRFLTSDRFTHKKGTMIRVKGSFVKGRCKVILEVETGTPPTE